MALINYPNGPWKTVFDGTFDDYPLRILFSKEGLIITEILNEDKTKAIVSISSVLGVKGDVESFSETLTKSNILLMVHTEKDTDKFFVLTQKAEFINSDDAEAKNLVIEQTKTLEKNMKVVKDIAKSYELKIQTFSELEKSTQSQLFTNPITFATIASNTKLGAHIQNTLVSESKQVRAENQINIGFHKTTNEKSFEQISLFAKTLVIYGEDKQAKNHIQSVITEEFALNDINVLLFTFDKNTENMKYPNDNDAQVRAKLQTDPIGFPIALTTPNKESLFADLKEISAAQFCELYALNSNENTTKIISYTIDKYHPGNLDTLYSKLEKYEPTEEITKYDVLLSQRLIETIRQKYSDLYQGEYNTENYTEVWSQKMGKVNIILLKEDNTITNTVIVHNIIKKLYKTDKPIAIVLPFADDLLSKELNGMQTEILNLIKQNKKKFFVLFTPKEVDLNSELIKNAATIIQSTGDNDIALKVKDTKPYRVELRPTLSKL